MSDWTEDAPCREIGGELFFPDAAIAPYYYARARRICAGCPVRRRCLEAALAHEGDSDRWSRHGMWGGLVPAERYELHLTRRAAA